MGTTAMSPEDAKRIIGEGFDAFYFNRDTSSLGSRLAAELRGGRKADPNVGPAIRTAEELERRLEALSIVRNLPPAPPPSDQREPPPSDDLPALLSDAGRDARYVKHLLAGGSGMFVSQVPEALRIVRALLPKLEAIWSVYETLPQPERVALTGAEQEAFWRKLEADLGG